MLGFPILYCKGMRPMMFQLSGFCYRTKFMVSRFMGAWTSGRFDGRGLKTSRFVPVERVSAVP